MKLAAATFFSLVAIATYALPVAYSENQVSAQYSAINEPVIVHLEKRAGEQPGLSQGVPNIQESVNDDHRQQEREKEKLQRQQKQQNEKRKTSKTTRASRTRSTTTSKTTRV
ncbi:hypothetical protein BASA83_013285 [Batrachochytrium salamandrivorans]|nr:hypothetical protein BASA83_013285 [Batrachochytrium salamandrivorans]